MILDLPRQRSSTRPEVRHLRRLSLRIVACAAAALAPASMGCAQILGIDELGQGGGDAGAPDSGAPDVTAPRIADMAPAPDATGVAPDAVLTVTFDEPVNPESAAAGNVELHAPDGAAVTGTVRTEGSTVSFVPDDDLALLGTYTVTIGANIADVAGNGLGTEQSWTFTVRDGAWGTSELIETNNAGRSFDQHVAMDGRGNAIAVWDQTTTVWANRYDIDEGWGVSQLLESKAGTDARDARVAMDEAGNAIAVWCQIRGTRFEVWTRHYEVDKGWGEATPIGNLGTGDALEPRIAMSPSGSAVVVWTQLDDGSTTQASLWGATYTPEGGWDIPQLIENDGDDNVVTPRVAIDRQANAVVVWTQDNGTRTEVWANRNVAGTSWLVPERFESTNGAQPDVALDAEDNGVAVWQAGADTMASRYDGRVGWGTPELVLSGTTGAPHVAVDPRGNGVVVAQHEVVASRPGRVVAAHYDPSAGWRKPVVIGALDVPAATSSPVVAMDALGNAIAVWDFHDADPIMLVTARYTPGSGWSPDAELVTPQSGQDPQIALNGQGKAWIVWGSRNGDFRRDINATPFR